MNDDSSKQLESVGLTTNEIAKMQVNFDEQMIRYIQQRKNDTDSGTVETQIVVAGIVLGLFTLGEIELTTSLQKTMTVLSSTSLLISMASGIIVGFQMSHFWKRTGDIYSNALHEGLAFLKRETTDEHRKKVRANAIGSIKDENKVARYLQPLFLGAGFLCLLILLVAKVLY